MVEKKPLWRTVKVRGAFCEEIETKVLPKNRSYGSLGDFINDAIRDRLKDLGVIQ